MQNGEPSPNQGCIITTLVQEEYLQSHWTVEQQLFLARGDRASLKVGRRLCFSARAFRQFVSMDVGGRTSILAHVLEAFSIYLVR